MEKLAKYKNRIGAWVTATSFHNIVKSYISHHLNNQISDGASPPTPTITTSPDDHSAETAATSTSSTSSNTASVTSEESAAATAESKIERIIIKSKTEDIQNLPNNILLIQVLDILIQKGLKPAMETLDLIKMNIGPQEESNLVYQKFQYLADKVQRMHKQTN